MSSGAQLLYIASKQVLASPSSYDISQFGHCRIVYILSQSLQRAGLTFTLSGITSCGYSRKEVLQNFKVAIPLHRKENPQYIPPQTPSPKAKAKEHQIASVERSTRMFGKENILTSLELLEY